MGNTQQIVVRLPAASVPEIDAAAARLNMSRNRFICAAIAAHGADEAGRDHIEDALDQRFEVLQSALIEAVESALAAKYGQLLDGIKTAFAQIKSGAK